MPVLKLFFSLDGRIWKIEFFVVNKSINVVLRGKALLHFLFMLINSALKAIRIANVQTPRFTSQNVDVESFHKKS